MENTTIQLWENAETKPEIEQPTQLRNMLTKTDMQHYTKNRFYWIGLKVNGQTFFAEPKSIVCQNQTTILRDRTNNIIGLPLVAGG